MAGCVQATPRYLQASAYDRAVMLYESGQLSQARQKALDVPSRDPDFKAARKLVGEINSVSVQLSRRHMDMADDYERAGIYGKAIDEYMVAFAFNPANTLIKSRIEMLREAIKGGRRFEAEKPEAKAKKQEKEDPEIEANNHYVQGKIYLESNSYAKAIEEFNSVLKYMPAYMNTKELLTRSIKERDRAVDTHLKKGIGLFQREEMERAIREWELVLELDPVNKDALDYRSRAEMILEQLRKIKEKAVSERPL
ncbi:MAG: hypothetical protein HY889_00900 [Deltaproteobacteria bacterium]|nr:hypothetical protein [Deltaproteobacteria bacterium]